jgi:hypothetical protein
MSNQRVVPTVVARDGDQRGGTAQTLFGNAEPVPCLLVKITFAEPRDFFLGRNYAIDFKPVWVSHQHRLSTRRPQEMSDLGFGASRHTGIKVNCRARLIVYSGLAA